MRQILFTICLLLAAFTAQAQDAPSPARRRLATLVYAQAVQEMEARRYDAAYDLMQHVLTIDPQHSAALYKMFVFNMALRRDSVAGEYLQQAVALDPDNADYIEMQASWWERIDSLELATECFERLADLQRWRPEVRSHLGELYLEQNRFDDALEQLRRLELAEGTSMELLSTRYNVLLTGKEDTVAAVAALREAVRQNPVEMQYQLLLAECYMTVLHEPDSARIILNRINEEEPRNPQLQMARLTYAERFDTLHYEPLRDSMLYSPNTDANLRRQLMLEQVRSAIMDSTKAEAAHDMYRRLNELLPDDEVVLATQAAFMEQQKAPIDTVIDILRHVHRLQPDDRHFISLLVDKYVSADRIDSLAALCDEAVSYYPDEFAFYYFGAMAHYQCEREEMALQRFQQAARHAESTTSPDALGRVYSAMGDLLHSFGRVEEAFAAYDSCLAVAPDNVLCLNNYAYYLSLAGRDLARAEKMSYRTLRLEPGNRTYIDTYAWILYEQRNYGQAREYIDKCLEGIGTVEEADSAGISSDVFEHAGDIYLMLGLADEAMPFYQLALDLGSDHPAIIRRKMKKKKIK